MQFVKFILPFQKHERKVKIIWMPRIGQFLNTTFEFSITRAYLHDNGYSLIWMRFSTLSFLFYTAGHQSFQNKTGLAITVNLTASKRKEGSSHCL